MMLLSHGAVGATTTRIVAPFALLLSLLPTTGLAEVFHARSEIGRLAFPDADRVLTRDIFITLEQRAEIVAKARSDLDSDLVSIYEGYVGARLLGYALLDSHIVRTLPEALLIVLDSDGRVAATHVMAFHEPLEYLPSRRWLDLFTGRGLSDDLGIDRGVVGITGATLSAHAVMGSIRRALAIYEVLLARH